MKQVKILYKKCKEKLPNRPPDEIDFGLGFRAALRWIVSCDTDLEADELIEKELE